MRGGQKYKKKQMRVLEFNTLEEERKQHNELAVVVCVLIKCESHSIRELLDMFFIAECDK
jgi:hypothetical protein